MESQGERFKKIRLEKGLSIEEVAKKTKIHLNILKAIEEDSLVNFNPVYIKGFLKIYCKFLGLDPKDYIADYKEARTKFEPVSVVPRQKKAAPSLFKTASLKLTSFKLNMAIIKKALALVLVLVFLIGVFKLGKAISLKRASSRSADVGVAPSYRAERKPGAARTQKQEGGQAASVGKDMLLGQRQQADKVRAASGVRLTIRARETCLLQVKLDGKVFFYGRLTKGRSETWQAKEKIELLVGNAGVVELHVNDKFYSNLGKKGQTLRNIVITKDGLNIGR